MIAVRRFRFHGGDRTQQNRTSPNRGVQKIGFGDCPDTFDVLGR